MWLMWLMMFGMSQAGTLDVEVKAGQSKPGVFKLSLIHI